MRRERGSVRKAKRQGRQLTTTGRKPSRAGPRKSLHHAKAKGTPTSKNCAPSAKPELWSAKQAQLTPASPAHAGKKLAKCGIELK
jgi:hypothetical protein